MEIQPEFNYKTLPVIPKFHYKTQTVVIIPYQYYNLITDTDFKAMKELQIELESDIGRVDSAQTFNTRLSGAQFTGLVIYEGVELTRYDMEYLLTRIFWSKNRPDQWVLRIDDYHKKLIADILSERIHNSIRRGYDGQVRSCYRTAEKYRVTELLKPFEPITIGDKLID